MILREKLPPELVPAFEEFVKVTVNETLDGNQHRNKLMYYLMRQNYQNEIRLSSQQVLVEEIKEAAGVRKTKLLRPHKIAALACLILLCASLVIAGILTQFLLHRQKIEASRKNTLQIMDRLTTVTPIENPPMK